MEEIKMTKDYPNHLKNQELRRKNPNIRKIVKGKPTSYWDNDKEKK